MKLYSQRDPLWDRHPLGWGPALGTIGAYGCYDTVCAMIATDALGVAVTPPKFDDYATAKRIFLRDPSGTYDFLPDNALDLIFVGRFKTTSYAGFRGDLIKAAVAAPKHYAYVHISTPTVPTHYVLMASEDANTIADPWYGKYGTLAGYGGVGAVVKTYIVEVKPAPVVVITPPPPVVPPIIPVTVTPSTVPINPAPVPLPSLPPVASKGCLRFGL